MKTRPMAKQQRATRTKVSSEVSRSPAILPNVSAEDAARDSPPRPWKAEAICFVLLLLA